MQAARYMLYSAHLVGVRRVKVWTLSPNLSWRHVFLSALLLDGLVLPRSLCLCYAHHIFSEHSPVLLKLHQYIKSISLYLIRSPETQNCFPYSTGRSSSPILIQSIFNPGRLVGHEQLSYTAGLLIHLFFKDFSLYILLWTCSKSITLFASIGAAIVLIVYERIQEVMVLKRVCFAMFLACASTYLFLHLTQTLCLFHCVLFETLMSSQKKTTVHDTNMTCGILTR